MGEDPPTSIDGDTRQASQAQNGTRLHRAFIVVRVNRAIVFASVGLRRIGILSARRKPSSYSNQCNLSCLLAILLADDRPSKYSLYSILALEPIWLTRAQSSNDFIAAQQYFLSLQVSARRRFVVRCSVRCSCDLLTLFSFLEKLRGVSVHLDHLPSEHLSATARVQEKN